MARGINLTETILLGALVYLALRPNTAAAQDDLRSAYDRFASALRAQGRQPVSYEQWRRNAGLQ